MEIKRSNRVHLIAEKPCKPTVQLEPAVQLINYSFWDAMYVLSLLAKDYMEKIKSYDSESPNYSWVVFDSMIAEEQPTLEDQALEELWITNGRTYPPDPGFVTYKNNLNNPYTSDKRKQIFRPKLR